MYLSKALPIQKKIIQKQPYRHTTKTTYDLCSEASM